MFHSIGEREAIRRFLVSENTPSVLQLIEAERVGVKDLSPLNGPRAPQMKKLVFCGDCREARKTHGPGWRCRSHSRLR